MKPEIRIEVDFEGRTVYVRASGIFKEEDAREVNRQFRDKVTFPFRGRKHMMIADMRGMRATSAETARIMGEGISFSRKHGLVLCVHLSDDTVRRLQAARMGRENAVGDDVTVEVSSLEEAYRVVEEYRARLDDERYATSSRTGH